MAKPPAGSSMRFGALADSGQIKDARTTAARGAGWCRYSNWFTNLNKMSSGEGAG